MLTERDEPLIARAREHGLGLVDCMGRLREVARADRRSEQDELGRLAARLEVASGVPDGLCAT